MRWRLEGDALNLLITFAVEEEFDAWRRRHEFQRIAVEPWSVYALHTAKLDVRVWITGMGYENARLAMKSALAEPADACLSTGFAGALRAQYSVGDILAARAIADEAGERDIPCDARLLDTAGAAGATLVERFVASSRVAVTAQEKRRLSEFGDAVEMEGMAVLEAAAEKRVPAVACRAVSDTLDEDLAIDFNRVITPKGRVSFPLLLGEVVRHPLRLPRLVALAKRSGEASFKLAGFLDRFVKAIAEQNLNWKSNHGVLVA